MVLYVLLLEVAIDAKMPRYLLLKGVVREARSRGLFLTLATHCTKITESVMSDRTLINQVSPSFALRLYLNESSDIHCGTLRPSYSLCLALPHWESHVQLPVWAAVPCSQGRL